MQESTEQPDDRYNLDRFVQAQAGIYDQALHELQRGSKRSHWMWFIFPQIDGLGMSSMSRRYAITGIEEAREYVQHPVLGPRLVACCEALLGVEGRTAYQILSSPDDMKLQSSMTLFAQVSEPGAVFGRVLAKYYGGEQDAATLRLLGQ